MTRPTLLILPGLDGTGVTAGPFADRLAGRVQTVRVTFSTSQYRPRPELAAAVLQDWPVAGPVVVLGESFSSAVAVGVARARPTGLAGVVLVTPTFAAPPRLPIRLAVRFHPRWLPAVRPPAVALRWLLAGDSRPAGDLLTRAVRGVDPGVLLARAREYFGDPAADDPTGVGVPVLAIQAGRDRSLTRRPSAPRPGVEWVTVDAPHLVLAAAPAAAAEVVAGFAGRVAG